MEDNKNSIEMIIFVSDLTKYNQGINEWIELDLMNPTEAKRKYEDFQKANEGHEFFISDTSMTYGLGVNEYDNIDFLLELADNYFIRWSEEQIMVFSDLINELEWDWDDASDKVNNYDYTLIEIDDDDCESAEEAVGRYYAESLNIPDYIEPYFDYESYGMDILIEVANVITDDYVIIVY